MHLYTDEGEEAFESFPHMRASCCIISLLCGGVRVYIRRPLPV